MTPHFVQQIERLRRRLQRRQVAAALCWTLVGWAGTALVLVALDRLLGIDDTAGRVFLTLVFLSVAVAIGYRGFRAAFAQPWTALAVARRIEAFYPRLDDVLTSALAFSRQTKDEPAAGSPALRRAVVLQAATAVEDLDWNRLVPHKPLRQASISALAMVLVLAGLVGWMPQAMAVGFSRLVNPFHQADWPREYHLQFVDPPQYLAEGSDFVALLQDASGSLPETIAMHYRTRSGSRWVEEMDTLATGGDNLEIRRPNMEQAFEFRATGGDHHTMPWQRVEVIKPPRIESLQLTVRPPEYSGLAQETLEVGTPVLAGSELLLRGAIDRPISEIALQGEDGWQVPARLAEDGKHFETAPWQAEQSRVLQLAMTSPEGVTTTARRRLAIDVLPDQPPAVHIVLPAEELFLLPRAVVEFAVEARDNLALQSVGIEFRNTTTSEEQIVDLYEGPPVSQVADAPSEKTVSYEWNLAESAYQVGYTFEIRAVATDYRGGRGASSPPLRAHVIAREELLKRLQEQQAEIVAMLQQLADQQQRLLDQSTSWSESSSAETDAVHSALYRQRQIHDVLARNEDALLTQIENLLDQLERNQLSRIDFTERLRDAFRLVRQLAEEPLPQVESRLERLAFGERDDRESTELLSALVILQQAVATGLQQAVDLLDQGDLLLRFERELIALEREQQQIADQTQAALTARLEQSEGEPASTELADLIRRQRGLARRVAQTLFRMREAAGQARDEEPLLADRLADTAELAEQLRVQQTSRTAVDQLRQEQLGLAVSQQQQVAEELRQLIAKLTGRDPTSALERFEQLQQAERQLNRLRRSTAQLAQKERRAEQLSEAEREQLRRNRRALAEETDEFTRRLEQLEAPRAAEATQQASEQLQQPAGDTNQAEEKLAEAQRELADVRRRHQVALAQQQLAELENQLTDFLSRQQTIRDELYRTGPTAEYQQKRAELANDQTALRGDLLAIVNSFASLPVFEYQLENTAQQMRQVVEHLNQQEIVPARRSADEILAQLEQMADAAKSQRQDLTTAKPPSGSGNGGQQQQGANPAQAQTLQLIVGQLRLVRSLQTVLQEETRQLEAEIAEADDPAPALLDRAKALAARQQQLRELAEQIQPEPIDLEVNDPENESEQPSSADELPTN